MNKKDLVAEVADSSGTTKTQAEVSVNAVLEAIIASLSRNEPVQLVGFGTFTVVNRAARKGRNPQTGKEIQIPACKLPQFKPGNRLREAVR